MPHFTRQLTNGAPIVLAVLSVTQARADAFAAANLPVPQFQRMNALIDTGASCTCVDPAIITALELTPTGSTQMFTPSTGSQGHTTDQYDANLKDLLFYAAPTAGNSNYPRRRVRAASTRN